MWIILVLWSDVSLKQKIFEVINILETFAILLVSVPLVAFILAATKKYSAIVASVSLSGAPVADIF